MTLIKPEIGIMVIPGKLYVHSLSETPKDTPCDHYFEFDDLKNVSFEPISRENGPSTLPQIQAFFNVLKDKLTKINKQIHICCSLVSESRLNLIFLICAFIIIESDFLDNFLKNSQNLTNKSRPPTNHKKLPDYDHPLSLFEGIYPKIEDYNDITNSTFTITIEDALNGLVRAHKNKWFDISRFDPEFYNFYLATENGFMTWIVPDRLLIMSSPSMADTPLLFDMLPLLRKWNIRTIVNFTSESRGFEDLQRVGIENVTLNVPQDSLPSMEDTQKFIEICDRGRPVAICSMNGLGRGPMFAALWIAHSFGFPPKEAIGWVRIARQGSIYGVQQDFILRMDKVSNKNSKVQNKQPKSVTSLGCKNKCLKNTRLGSTGRSIVSSISYVSRNS